MPGYADFGGWVISTIAGWFVVTADTGGPCAGARLFVYARLLRRMARAQGLGADALWR